MNENDSKLTHLNEAGDAHMVSISGKSITKRSARAQCWIEMAPETLRAVLDGTSPKGDVLAVSRIAGIQAAKETSRAIPLCHPLPLTHVEIRLEPDNSVNRILIEATCSCEGKTGVEMEALHAASVSALTLYDMLKAVDKSMMISGLRVTMKTGGKSDAQYQDPLEG